MSAGLPGIGLGGLFFICSALLAPVAELARTVRGQSSRERWNRVARQFAMALVMLLAIQAALLGMRYVAGTPALALTGFPLITLGLLAAVLGLVRLLALVLSHDPRSSIRRRRRWALLGSNQ